jgi:hypothetical protein
LALTSNTESCEPPFYQLEIASWRRRDANGDGRPDLLVEATEARAPKPARYECGEEPKLPAPTRHRLTFLFDGKGLPAHPGDGAAQGEARAVTVSPVGVPGRSGR